MTVLASRTRTTSFGKRAGRWGDVPAGFDAALADAVYARIMKCADDDEAAFTAGSLLAELWQADLALHRDALSKRLELEVRERADTLAAPLARQVLAKSAAGDEAGAEALVERIGELFSVAQAFEVAKAFSGSAFTPQGRAEEARQRVRDVQTGQFVQMHHKVVYGPDVRDPRVKPLDTLEESRLGIPRPTVKDDSGKETPVRLTAEQRKHYQEAYAQVRAAIQPYTHLPRDGSQLRLIYDDTSATLHDIPKTGHTLAIDPKRRLYSAEVSLLPGPAGLDLSPYQTLRDMGAHARSDHNSALHAQGLLGYADRLDHLDPTGNDEFIPVNRAFRRLDATSELLNHTLGPVAPPKVRTALSVGRAIGQNGPAAQRLVGPTADKLAYRYRGIERPPDPRLATAIEAVRLDPGLKVYDRAGAEQPRKSAAARREHLVHGREDASDATQAPTWSPSLPLLYFKGRLPDMQLSTLQRMSGTVPPSEGALFDKSGRLVSQAVGFGDDHYVPFTPKSLGKLKGGGEYIRTRSFGGPTTEDIHTGLLSGAKAMTVVSHSGVYTVDFDQSLRGTRRYNDKAARMVARYGQLLDAVQSEQVAPGMIAPSRIEEIEQAARKRFDPTRNPEGYKSELRRLKVAEQNAPTMSKLQRGAVAAEWLAQQGLGRHTADGREMSVAEMSDELARQTGHRAYADYTASHPGAGAREQDFVQGSRAMLAADDPVLAAGNVANALGRKDAFTTYMARADEDYKRGLRPLRLNGRGYYAALQALREQFPYYIGQVRYHPWPDVALGAAGTADRGYVKPRHNRPHDVLAGYFDRSITGRGKVHADSIRFQNRRHARGTLDDYRSPKDSLEQDIAGRKTTPAAGAAAAPLSPEVAAGLREEADLKLLAALRDPELRFSTGLRGGGHLQLDDAAAARLRGTAVSALSPQQLDSLRAIAPALHRIWTLGEDQLGEDPARLHRDLVSAVRVVRGDRALELDGTFGELLRAHEQEGRPEPRREIGDVGAMLHRPTGNWNVADLGGAFDPADESGSTELQLAYAADEKIGLVPELPAELHADGFGAAAAQARTRLLAAHNARLRYEALGEAGERPKLEADEIADQVEGLVRAHALRARLAGAAARDQAARERQAAQVEAARPDQELHVHYGMSPEQEESLRHVGLAPGVLGPGETGRDRSP